MKTKKAIQNVELSFVCLQNWDSMTVCGNGRFCNVCQKIVYDFTDKSQKDYEIALRQHGGQMCGRFTKQQLSPSVKIAKVAALAALSFGATEVNAQNADTIPYRLIGEVEIPTKQEYNKDYVFGIVEENPEFVDGYKARHQFIKDSLKYPIIGRDMGIEGTVFVGFIVETDGRLTDIQVRRYFHPDFSAEALRVVNLMQGKWKAGKQSGKPVRVAYTIPIKFRLE